MKANRRKLIIVIMRLFHITDNITYKIGDVISVNDFEGNMCFYHEKHIEHRWINDFLNACKPDNYPSRRKCIYAFDNPGHCFFFLSREPLITDHCYEVEMNAVGGFPMILTGWMIRHRNNTDSLRNIAEEYWHPTNPWNFCEYMGSEMTIISEVNLDNAQRNVSRNRYMMDYDRAMFIFQ